MKKRPPIDIDRLEEEELIDLNHRVVERLRLLRQIRAHTEMMEFRIGEVVAFHPPGRPPVVGVLAKYNKKSVTIISKEGMRWNVHPSLIARAQEKERVEFMPSQLKLVE